jgi:hypothetical protein
MRYLYGSKRGGTPRLVATFASEPQLLAYARWATLEFHGEQSDKYEQKSALAGHDSWEQKLCVGRRGLHVAPRWPKES